MKNSEAARWSSQYNVSNNLDSIKNQNEVFCKSSIGDWKTVAEWTSKHVQKN